MSKHLHRAVQDLRTDLVEQFGVVEQMINMSVRALVERRPDMAVQVIETDDKVDAKDIRIEEECLKLLALYQPVAIDLRWMVSAIKLNGDLERMADLACNIAERSKSLDLFPLFKVPDDINQMVTITLEMVRSALDSFIEQDAELAREVISRDDEVDRLNVELIEELQSMMKPTRTGLSPLFIASVPLATSSELPTWPPTSRKKPFTWSVAISSVTNITWKKAKLTEVAGMGCRIRKVSVSLRRLPAAVRRA